MVSVISLLAHIIIFMILRSENTAGHRLTEISRNIHNKRGTQLEKPITLTIYYETLCPDSLKLLEAQLLPILENGTSKGTSSLVNIESLIHLQLIPYGKASTLEESEQDLYSSFSEVYDEKSDFLCQHGPLECEGNKLHSCAINSFAKYTESHQSSKSLVKFLICSMKNLMAPKIVQRFPLKSTNLTSFSSAALELCIEELTPEYPELLDNLNQSQKSSSLKTEISQCLQDGDGTALQKFNGELTNQLSPKLYFVPWITFNGIWNKNLMEDCLEDLRDVFCQLITADNTHGMEVDTSGHNILPYLKILGCQNQNFLSKYRHDPIIPSGSSGTYTSVKTSSSTGDLFKALKKFGHVPQKQQVVRPNYVGGQHSQHSHGPPLPPPSVENKMRYGRSQLFQIHPLFAFDGQPRTTPIWKRSMANLRDRRGFFPEGGDPVSWRFLGAGRQMFARDLAWRRPFMMN